MIYKRVTKENGEEEQKGKRAYKLKPIYWFEEQAKIIAECRSKLTGRLENKIK